MSTELTIGFNWERLEEGLPEERSCFGMLQVCFGQLLLTEGQDGFIDCTRRGPLVSGYHLAEWMAWNWWRLTREPRPDVPTSEWHFAHCLGTVGAGYLWPNITIASDRQRTLLIAKPTRPQGFSAFRFTADWTVVLPTTHFESALDRFMAQIQGKLRADRVAPTNFDQRWTEVLAERADPDSASQRELEAVLGYDPDEGDAGQVQQLLADAGALGHDAIIELSADHRPGRSLPTAAEIKSWATDFGSSTRPADIPRITGLDLSGRATQPAWRQGYHAARALREQHGLAYEPLPDQRLAELCAVSPLILQQATQSSPLAFALDDESHGSARVALRSHYPTGRRFELARLLGDRIASGLDEPMIPATRSHTYRQKLQRAFAAELLCPFEALEAFLDGDYSEQAREDAAEHFSVSERTVWTLLVNNGRLEKYALDDDAETLGASRKLGPYQSPTLFGGLCSMTISIPFASPLAGLSDFFTAWQGLHLIVPVHPVAEVAPELADRLAAFFTAWTELRNALPSDQPVPGPLAPLLQRFFTAWKPLQTGVEPQRPAPVIEGAVRVADMTRFFRNFGPALQARAEHRRLGSGINVWEASGLGWDELRNSKVLAWLLDCRGTHGQGAGILAGLLDCIARKSSEFPVSANTVLPYWTRIELCPWGENGSRVDIEVDGDALLLFIEVKIGAMETTDQLDRYLAIGRAKARDRPWGVIYLTRHGRLPLRFIEAGANLPLIPISWSDVKEVLEQQVRTLPDCFARHVLRQLAEHIHSFR